MGRLSKHFSRKSFDRIVNIRRRIMTNELFGKKTFDKSDLFYGAR